MQKYVTPHPGRTQPKEMIVNRPDYKLDFTLTEFRQNQYLLSVNKFIPETGWCEQKFFLTPEELARIQDVINARR